MILGMELRDYQVRIIEEARDAMRRGHRRILITSPTGCLTGDTVVGVNRCGKGFSASLGHVVRSFNGVGRWRWDLSKPTYIRRCQDGVMRLGLLRGATFSGVKETFTINTDDGRSISATACHRFMTPGGYVKLGDLSVGDELVMEGVRNGGERVQVKKFYQYMNFMFHHPYARRRMRCERGSHRVAVHRLVAESRINGLCLGDYVHALRTDPRSASRFQFVDPKTHAVHHINGDHRDNSPDNLMVLTHADHHKIHASQDGFKHVLVQAGTARIHSICANGMQETFDLELSDDPHNFSANGFIVHNSGKTVLVAYMMKQAAERGVRSMMVVHRRELLDQTVDTLRRVGISPEIMQSGKDRGNVGSHVLVAGIQTLVRRLQHVQEPGLIIADECHRTPSKEWSMALDTFYNAYRIGLSATPMRLDGKGLKGHFDYIVRGPEVRDLIDQGYLAKYKLYAPPSGVDMSGVRKSMGDYAKGEAAAVVDKPHITGCCIEHYKRHCPTAQTIVFCINVGHSKHVAQQFNDAGIPALHIDGRSDERKRKEGITGFREGSIRVLCNCDLFGEGLDVPGIQAAILLRPTQSTGLYMQQVGRALRPDASKPCAYILDHVGNCHRHGLPCDRREWSLEGFSGKRGRAESTPGIRICSACYAANRAARGTCEYCGAELEVVRTVEVKEGSLSEVTSRTVDFKAERASARTFEDLVALGKKRGMSNPGGWAYNILKARRKRAKC